MVRRYTASIPSLPISADVRDVYLVFGVGREFIDPLTLQGGEPLGGPDLQSLPDDDYSNILKLSEQTKEALIQSQVNVPSDVSFVVSGERPRLAKIVYALDNAGPESPKGDLQGDNHLSIGSRVRSIIATDPDYCPPPQPPSFVFSGEPALSHLFGLRRWQKELHRAVNRSSELGIQKYRRFFAWFERETNPKLFWDLLKSKEAYRRERALKFVIPFLDGRIHERAKQGHTGRVPQFTPLDSHSTHFKKVRYLSRVQVKIMSDWFQRIPGIFDLDAFEDAFEMFANGELRLRLDVGAWATQPSSYYYFFFAEFALVCVEHDVDIHFWSAVAKVLVRSQRVFMRTYGSGKHGFSSYDACHFDEAKRFSRKEKNELWSIFAGLDMNRLSIACAQTMQEANPYQDLDSPYDEMFPAGEHERGTKPEVDDVDGEM